MSSNKSITSSGSTRTEHKSSTTQQQRSSTTQQSAHKTKVSKTTGSESIKSSSQNFGGNSQMTTTTTIYDADGNVVKTITNVDDQPIPTGQNRSIEYISTSNDNRRNSAISDDTTADNQNGRRIEIQQEYDNRSFSPTSQADSVATTYYVDENYVDTNKMRNKNASSDFKNFYGHGRDPSKTVVGNAYDSNAIQNTIGTRGRVIMDHNIDTTDVIFSNDRNYGKTGWNGQFTDEEPQIRKTVQAPKQKPWDRSLRGKAKLRPEDLPPAGVPSVKKPW